MSASPTGDGEIAWYQNDGTAGTRAYSCMTVAGENRCSRDDDYLTGGTLHFERHVIRENFEGVSTVFGLDIDLDGDVDMVEICGGEARTSTIAVRRHLRAGPNYDLVTNVDLKDVEHQAAVIHYFRTHRPLVAVMAPTCKPFGRWATFNYLSLIHI